MGQIFSIENIDLNSQENQSETPLKTAVHFKQIAAVDWLLEHGTDPNIIVDDNSLNVFYPEFIAQAACTILLHRLLTNSLLQRPAINAHLLRSGNICTCLLHGLAKEMLQKVIQII